MWLYIKVGCLVLTFMISIKVETILDKKYDQHYRQQNVGNFLQASRC